MIKNSEPKQRHVHEKIQCDVFFSHKDVTALRWISEINRILAGFQEYVVINVHEIDSDHARELQVHTDSVVINNEKLEFYQINKVLFELATAFVNDIREFKDTIVIAE